MACPWWLAQKGAQVVCSDLREPIDRGRSLHERYGVKERIRYEKINALRIPYRNHFDIVIFKSLLGGIRGNVGDEAHLEVTNSIYEALKPGGLCLFAENLSGAILHRLARKYFVPWGTRWKYMTRREIPLAFERFDSLDWISLGFLGLFGRGKRSQYLFGLLDRYLLEAFLPKSWHYIAIGVAHKSGCRPEAPLGGSHDGDGGVSLEKGVF